MTDKLNEELNAAAVSEALSEVLGVQWKVQAITVPAAGSAPPSPAPTRPTSAPAAPGGESESPSPSDSAFVADIDEPSDDDEDDPNPALSGVALLEAELGAKVIGEVDTT
jgi:DNA polymerase-3 subunit gamma/tau